MDKYWTVGQFKTWLEQNKVPDNTVMSLYAYREVYAISGAEVDETSYGEPHIEFNWFDPVVGD